MRSALQLSAVLVTPLPSDCVTKFDMEPNTVELLIGQLMDCIYVTGHTVVISTTLYY